MEASRFWEATGMQSTQSKPTFVVQIACICARKREMDPCHDTPTETSGWFLFFIIFLLEWENLSGNNMNLSPVFWFHAKLSHPPKLCFFCCFHQMAELIINRATKCLIFKLETQPPIHQTAGTFWALMSLISCCVMFIPCSSRGEASADWAVLHLSVPHRWLSRWAG